MTTKFFSIFIACFIVTSVFSQASLDNYKYVLVPKKYDFLKEQDQYQVNSLTKFLFNKYGFTALFQGDDYPKDLSLNRCLGLRSNVIKGSGLFKTKLTVELKDCNDKVIFTSQEGESREKDFKTAYNLALRDAFKSIEALDYKYEPNEKITSLASNNTKQEAKSEVSEEIQQLKQEIEALKKAKEVQPIEEVVSKEEAKGTLDNVASVSKEKPIKERVIEGLTNILYAQEIKNGFQLVDSSPKVVYKIKKTGQENLFFVEGENAIIYKKDGAWIYEYNTVEGVKQKELNIKF